MSALNTYWTTIGVTALPPGWINVFETGELPPAAVFTTAPCPAMLLQEQVNEDGERETRVVPAVFDGGELIPVEDHHHHTTTAEEWQTQRAEAEQEVVAAYPLLRRWALGKIEAAGETGVPAWGLTHSCRARVVCAQIEREGLVTATWEPDPDDPMDRVYVYRLATAAGGAK